MEVRFEKYKYKIYPSNMMSIDSLTKFYDESISQKELERIADQSARFVLKYIKEEVRKE